MTPSGIEPATFGFVAQRLNQLRHRRETAAIGITQWAEFPHLALIFTALCKGTLYIFFSWQVKFFLEVVSVVHRRLEPMQSAVYILYYKQIYSGWPCINGRFGRNCYFHHQAIDLFVYTTTHCSLKAYFAIWVRRSNFRHQASPHVSPRESTQRRKVELWARNVREFCLNADLHWCMLGGSRRICLKRRIKPVILHINCRDNLWTHRLTL